MNPFHQFFHHMHDRHHDRHGDRGHHDHHFGRHGHRGAGFGPGGLGFGGDAPQGLGGFGQGRKLGSRDLQLLILAMLAERARHGYELIKELELRSKGYYVPSPGMVYPSLSYLEEVGYASVETEGAKKLYTISVAGLGHLDENRAAVDAMWAQLSWFGERMDRMRQTFGEDAAMPSENDADGFGFSMRGGRGRGRGRGDPLGSTGSELHQAMHALGGALRDLAGVSVEERKRIVDILARAVAEIRNRQP